jgi:hypothetical protein
MALTLLDLAGEWLRDGVARKDGNSELQRKFAKDLYPTTGSKVINTITEHDLRTLVRSVMVRGATRQPISLFVYRSDVWMGPETPAMASTAGRRKSCRVGRNR